MEKGRLPHDQLRLFRSFWMGGYEGADHVNSHGMPLCLNDWNGHWLQASQDYSRLASMGIQTIRESIGWRLSTKYGQSDLSRLRQQAEQAQANGLQVIWTIHHYGLPPGVDFFSDDFSEQFAEFCSAVSAALCNVGEGPTIYQPINEISFVTWAITCSTLMHPYRVHSPERGYDLKCRLARAAIQGCDAIWANEPGARIVHTDPLIHVISEQNAEIDEQAEAQDVYLKQFEAWDMLCGRVEPSLGGAPRYLDILGVNYYPGNQWEHPSRIPLQWHLGDNRRCGLDHLLGEVWARYRRPLFVSETGHVGDGRAAWLDDVSRAALHCMRNGVPLEGICIYPLVDRTDWEQPEHWHRSGLWDVRPRPTVQSGTPTFGRVVHEPLLERLQHWQALLPPGDRKIVSFSHQTKVPTMSPLIVFSHLRWDFVYQRPQQLLSRLAAQRPVIFIEEPILGAARPVLERLHPCKGVEVLRCHVTGLAHGFADEHLPAMQAMLAQYVVQQDLDEYWLWFYTPMALPLAGVLQPAGVVYDCMDELSAFKHAPPELLLREDQLFGMADLVFTGGHSLYEAKCQRHPHVSCFPSSVDAAHYARPKQLGVEIALVGKPLQWHIPQPRLGYCGVIDERIDLPLIAALADARPQWQIVMVGPVVKIDPAVLPRRANIHWLGQQDYSDLPGLLHGWDVCLMPFALNESTRFISPTKTLEYLAAGCPVVSTPIRDVVTSYPSIVAIADTSTTFIEACHAALTRSEAQIKVAAAAVRLMLERTSWDRTALAMAQLLADFGKADRDERADAEAEDSEEQIFAPTREAEVHAKPTSRPAMGATS